MRVRVAGRSTVAGTTLRAIASVFAIAAKGFRLREFGVFNTTSTAVAVALVRFTNATGVGTGLTEMPEDPTIDGTPQMTAFAGHTGDGAVSAAIAQFTLGAAAGSGIVIPFGENGLVVPVGAANGIGIICPVGAGQILDFWYAWDE